MSTPFPVWGAFHTVRRGGGRRALCWLVVGLMMCAWSCRPLPRCLTARDCPRDQDGRQQVCNQGFCANSFLSCEQCRKDKDCAFCGGGFHNRCLQGRCQPPPAEPVVTSWQPVQRPVDILFMIDNSGSMIEEQIKLGDNINVLFARLFQEGVKDIHLGILVSDRDDINKEVGHLRRIPGQTTRFLDLNDVSQVRAVALFQEAVRVGVTGSGFEQPLAVLEEALGKPLIDTVNKGFRRNDSVLSIFFLTDEDDCSHDGRLDQSLPTDTCNYPSDVVLKDELGNPISTPGGELLRGQMEKLAPIVRYVNFLRNLGGTVVVHGMIGSPLPTAGQGPCQRDSDCGAQQRCLYANADIHSSDAIIRQCGGCLDGKGLLSMPGFRLFEIIRLFGGLRGWQPVCGAQDVYRQHMIAWANEVVAGSRSIALKKPLQNLDALKVELQKDNKSPIEVLEPARVTPERANCLQDSNCGDKQVCGIQGNKRGKCLGRGWIYEPGLGGDDPGRIRLSGIKRGEAWRLVIEE